MTSPGWIIGPRANGDIGFFVAKPGGNADTDPDSLLAMSITSKVSQLLMLGFVTSSTTVALGLSRSPFVFVTSENTLAGIPGNTFGAGPVRPSPIIVGTYPFSQVAINSNGASMTFSASVKTHFAVYGQPFT